MAYFTPGNGHLNGGAWPKGKRRNPWDITAPLKALRDVGLSWRDLEKLMGMDSRQVRKYASGAHFATEAVARKVAALVKKYV